MLLHAARADGCRKAMGPGVSMLTVREAAALLRVSTATVYALVRSGDVPHVRVSNSIRIVVS
jgi:excisionase family DNA binding protein